LPVHAYRYPPDKLLAGAKFGNWELFLKLSAKTDVADLWSAVDNQIYCGRWVTQVWGDGERAEAIETVHAPAYQETLLRCGKLFASKRAFLPVRSDLLRIVHVIVMLENASDQPIQAAIACEIHYPAFVWPGVYKVPDMVQRNKRMEHREDGSLIISHTIGRETEARVFGADVEPSISQYTDRGFSRTYAVTVPPGAGWMASMNLAVSNQGENAALETYLRAPSAAEALAHTEAFYEGVFRCGYVRTPEPIVNRAFDWAKINTVRVQHRYPAGFAFTNDPAQDIVVTRDVAWFVSGSDYLTPEFSRSMLDMISRYGIEPGGKITEFINATTDPPARSDYDLNINDDTPLIVIAVCHHFAVTRDRAALERFWPMVSSALEWILSQRRDGLVYTTSQEANVWGISGWRNIIPQSQISGAVTEINSECAYALRLGASLAHLMGLEAEGERYERAAEELKTAINTKLVSEKTGLYLLNIDPDGERHHDVTGDQIFPILFGVADEARKRKILDLLYTADFWTPFGVRTVGKYEKEYDPDYGIQLLGGVWPNLTAWVGYSGKTYSPRRLVSAMRNIWKISEVDDPKAYFNVMPGLFPERLSGDTFKSRGMAMSPWMPPTYLWLTYEGLLGFEPTVEGIRINPHLPNDWSWVGAKDVPVMGGRLSLFYHRRRLHATMAVGSRGRCEIYDEDVSRYVASDAPFCVAMRKDHKAVIFVGTDRAGGFQLKIQPPLVPVEETRAVQLAQGAGRMFNLRIR
jgi:glycogen debranching enzyme